MKGYWDNNISNQNLIMALYRYGIMDPNDQSGFSVYNLPQVLPNYNKTEVAEGYEFYDNVSSIPIFLSPTNFRYAIDSTRYFTRLGGEVPQPPIWPHKQYLDIKVMKRINVGITEFFSPILHIPNLSFPGGGLCNKQNKKYVSLNQSDNNNVRFLYEPTLLTLEDWKTSSSFAVDYRPFSSAGFSGYIAYIHYGTPSINIPGYNTFQPGFSDIMIGDNPTLFGNVYDTWEGIYSGINFRLNPFSSGDPIENKVFVKIQIVVYIGRTAFTNFPE